MVRVDVRGAQCDIVERGGGGVNTGDILMWTGFLKNERKNQRGFQEGGGVSKSLKYKIEFHNS